jgi:hypothetical protein
MRTCVLQSRTPSNVIARSPLVRRSPPSGEGGCDAAIHPAASDEARMDCFAALAMTLRHGNDTETWVRDLAASTARGLPLISASLDTKGARGCRVHGAPAVSCALGRKSAHTSIQVHRNHPASPHAMALRIMACSPRRDRPVCHRRRRNFFHRLAAGLWQRDHTFFPYASGAQRQKHLPRPPQPAPRL